MCDNVEEIDLDDVELTFRTNILSQFAITKFAVKRECLFRLIKVRLTLLQT